MCDSLHEYESNTCISKSDTVLRTFSVLYSMSDMDFMSVTLAIGLLKATNLLKDCQLITVG